MTRRGVLRAAGHAVAYLVLLVGLLALTDLHVGWNLDDGAYAIQAKVLDQSSDWAYPYRHRDVDPGSRWAPVSHSELTDQGSYPFVRYPAWEQVIRASRWAFGDVVGLYVPAFFGAVAAASLGGLLAHRLRPGAFAFGFWVVALGPMVVHSQALWAHTWLAALGAVVALALVRAVDRAESEVGWRQLGPPAVAALAAAMAALLRKDGLLLAAAASGAGGLMALVSPGSLWRRVSRAVPWAAPAAVGIAIALVNGRWVDHLAPGGPAIDGPGDVDTALVGTGFAVGRLRGATRSLVDGVGAAQAGTLLGVVGVALAITAGVVLSSSRRRRGDGIVLALVAVAVLLVRVAVAPSDLAGLLAASPVIALGIGAWRRTPSPPAERAVLLFCSIELALVLVTQYPEGGARDWGGRYLFPLLVPVVVVAALTLARVLDRAPNWRDPAVAGAMALVVALPTVAGLVATADLRANNQAATDAALSTGAPTVIRMPRYLTRVSWRALPEADWLSAADPADAAEALTRLRPGRVDPIAVMGPGAAQVTAAGYTADVRSPDLVVFTPS